MEKGSAIPYSLDKLQERGKFFVAPNEAIYTGQVIGENTRQDDMVVNVTKTKKFQMYVQLDLMIKLNLHHQLSFH